MSLDMTSSSYIDTNANKIVYGFKSVSNYSLSIPPQSAMKICYVTMLCRKINYVVKQEVDT